MKNPATNFRYAIEPVTPLEQNCTLVWSETTKNGAVIDPGGDLDRVKAAIGKTGISVQAILLTHGHWDHSGGALELAGDLSVDIIGPNVADQFLLENLEEAGARRGVFGCRSFTPDRWLEQGDKVELGDLDFAVHHCPGHSPGSVMFVNDAAKVVHVGDVVFRGSIGDTDLPGGDNETLVRSIRRRVLPLSDDYTFICGHGAVGTVNELKRIVEPFLH